MKTMVCIFAHPDDEAFGPAGTIAKYAKTGNVYIICVTRGDAEPEYVNGELSDLAAVREAELQKSAGILGVKDVVCLGYKDGNLCNNLYHRLADQIENKLEQYKPNILLTFEPRGVSGHLDHIAVSLVTTHVFYKLSYIRKLLYYCISEKHRKLIKNYFIYFPPGYAICDIDEVVNISENWRQKVAALEAHKSQFEDGQRIKNILDQLPQQEHFLVLKK